MKQRQSLRLLFSACLIACAGPALAAYNCNISTTSVGVLYTAANVDTNGSVTLTCTRDPATDGASLTYRIKANDGINAFATAPFRRTRLGATANYLRYILRRGTVAGGAATCGNTTTWRAPANGVTDVITGTLNFGTNASASVVWGYCVRVRGTPGGNPASPAAGVYTDNFLVTAQYPNNDAGALSPSVPATYTVGAGSQCVFNTFPTSMAFNYNAFSPTAQSVNRPFELRCSAGETWTLSISPQTSVVLGLRYSITSNVNAGTGTGADQVITLTGTMPAGQAGACATSNCAATQPHVVTINY